MSVFTCTTKSSLATWLKPKINSRTKYLGSCSKLGSRLGSHSTHQVKNGLGFWRNLKKKYVFQLFWKKHVVTCFLRWQRHSPRELSFCESFARLVSHVTVLLFWSGIYVSVFDDMLVSGDRFQHVTINVLLSNKHLTREAAKCRFSKRLWNRTDYSTRGSGWEYRTRCICGSTYFT